MNYNLFLIEFKLKKVFNLVRMHKHVALHRSVTQVVFSLFFVSLFVFLLYTLIYVHARQAIFSESGICSYVEIHS